MFELCKFHLTAVRVVFLTIVFFLVYYSPTVHVADTNTKEKWNVVQKNRSHVERGKAVQCTDIGTRWRWMLRFTLTPSYIWGQRLRYLLHPRAGVAATVTLTF